MPVKIPAIELRINEAWTRIPFRYGSACLTAVPLLHVGLNLEWDSQGTQRGYSADCLPPLWFDKDPTKDFRRNIQDQLQAIDIAKKTYEDLAKPSASGFESVYSLWKSAYSIIQKECQAVGLNRLTASFGSSLMERALIDAFCRAEKLPFHRALTTGALGFPLSTEPPQPNSEIYCRHTVGLGDALRVEDIPEAERLHDGLPEALEEDIEAYGLQYFKVKVRGDHEADLDRLFRLAELLETKCHRGYKVSLDGNEQYSHGDQLMELLTLLMKRDSGQRFVDSIFYIEQPLKREVTLEEEARGRLGQLETFKPVIIDESDEDLDSFRKAVELGYQGCSMKNCKGIFKSLHNRELCVQLNETSNSFTFFQTGEDLANLPVLPLQQDLTTLLTLGIDNAERNGHHFFPGLKHLSDKERNSCVLGHPDLYHPSPDGAHLKIDNGKITGKSLLNIGYGYTCEVDFESRTPVESWRYEDLKID